MEERLLRSSAGAERLPNLRCNVMINHINQSIRRFQALVKRKLPEKVNSFVYLRLPNALRKRKTGEEFSCASFRFVLYRTSRNIARGSERIIEKSPGLNAKAQSR
jgi:hypothetical protein